MAILFTQTDVDNIKAALLEVATRGAAEVEINNRRVKYTDYNRLYDLLERAQADVNAQTYGSHIKVKFIEVD